MRRGKAGTCPVPTIGVGGYGALSYKNFENDSARFAIDDISLLMHWEGEGRLRAFAELGLETPLVETASGHFSSQSYVRPRARVPRLSVRGQPESAPRQIPHPDWPLERHPCRPAGVDDIAPVDHRTGVPDQCHRHHAVRNLAAVRSRSRLFGLRHRGSRSGDPIRIWIPSARPTARMCPRH